MVTKEHNLSENPQSLNKFIKRYNGKTDSRIQNNMDAPADPAAVFVLF